MSYMCDICGKKSSSGGSIIRRGLSKKSGGIGMHIVKNNKRIFKPNIQSMRLNINGITRTVKICTSCLRSEKYKKF